ncbi:hypothetical protein [Haloferax marisrubri]|uniref:Uncharacterized protein n=1 Tax=Haloferax marisrubri TaxID=1544719 RepID=A0A2P4NU54_9EURY|nr:hypothetical protein [Haloferax marisrubri]POG56682.1 hypothetical protein AUR65_002315 [Haloferax marisrubri]
MPGRAPWGQAGTKESGETLAVNNRPKVLRKDLTQTSTLTAGESETVELYAPSGSVYTVKGAALIAKPPSGATGGTHFFQVESLGKVAVLLGRSDYTAQVKWNNGHFFTANQTMEPAEESAAIQSFYGSMATADEPVRVEYYNNLDVDQTNERTIEFLIEEVSY